MTDEYTHRPVTVEGKTAVVIGGTSGIGEAIALSFASEGADVVATSRTPEKVSDTAEKIRNRDAETIETTTDVASRESIDATRDRVIDAFGDVDVLVTSASAIARTAVDETTEAEWQHVLDIQLDGVYRATQSFETVMDEGSIINVSSLASQLAVANVSTYTAAKGGVDAYTRAAAKELAPDIRVNAIAPGYVVTPQNVELIGEGTETRERIRERSPMGDVADREEIAGAAVYLASDAASYTTGQILTVDGLFGKSVF
jgi:NAD(P)-dependent dehydrogenase (short-subunit alcohol dehydrogenase family)